MENEQLKMSATCCYTGEGIVNKGWESITLPRQRTSAGRQGRSPASRREQERLEKRVKERVPEATRSTHHGQCQLEARPAWAYGYTPHKALVDEHGAHPDHSGPSVVSKVVRTVVLPEYKAPSSPRL